jgi:hypothetical protein
MKTMIYSELFFRQNELFCFTLKMQKEGLTNLQIKAIMKKCYSIKINKIFDEELDGFLNSLRYAL